MAQGTTTWGSGLSSIFAASENVGLGPARGTMITGPAQGVIGGGPARGVMVGSPALARP